MKVKGLRWVIIALIFIATVINYIDRSALGIMWGSEDLDGSISQSLGLSKNDYSYILNIFMVAYALGQLFTGKIFDKVGTRIGYVLSIGIWGLSSFLHSTARGFLSLSIFRSLLGFSEAGNWPGAVKSNAEWFPIKERAIAQGLFNAGASIGSVIAPPLIAALFVAFGWKVTFMVIGSFGIVWIIPWLLINKAGPKKHPWITEKEKKYILEGQSEADQKDTDDVKGKSLREILSHKESWAVVVGRFFLEPIWWLFVGWMPIYLFDVYGFDVKEVGMFLWVPYVGAAVGSIAGGFVSGRIIAKTNSIDKGRKTTILIGGIIMLLGLIATVLIGDTAEKFVAIVFFVLFGFQFAISNVQTLPSDFFGGKSVGSLAGLGGMIGVFSVIIMNFLVPVVVDKLSYTPIFIAIAVFVPLGVGAIYYFARNIKSVEK
ncbi:MFS transporter [Marinifilum caeruleilacunae]|uniref:MFS transporter n=1 Tax=Marinifilum caeruleilacunae TaxID=2499076 RepID=A0ABX1WUN4_9BACT|nr:MFS transporter [Marinifilum caeruleilacunae]NOU59722.1 MFS transporter [Marinifilum caeruleilacunae]